MMCLYCCKNLILIVISIYCQKKHLTMVALLHFITHIIFLVEIKALPTRQFKEGTNGQSIHEHVRYSLPNPVMFQVKQPVFQNKILTKTSSLQNMGIKWKDGSVYRLKDERLKEGKNTANKNTLEKAKRLDDETTTPIIRKDITFYIGEPNEVIRTSVTLETKKTLELAANLSEVKQGSREDAIASECGDTKEQNTNKDPLEASLVAPQPLENTVLSKQTDTEIENSSADSPKKGWKNIRNYFFNDTSKILNNQKQSVTSENQTNGGECKNENLSSAKSVGVKPNVFSRILRLFSRRKRYDNDALQKPSQSLSCSTSDISADKNTEDLGNPEKADAKLVVKKESHSSDLDYLASELARQLQTTPGLQRACTTNKTEVGFFRRVKRWLTNFFTRKVPNGGFEMISNDEKCCQKEKEDFGSISIVPAPLLSDLDAITPTNNTLQVCNQTPNKILCEETNGPGDAAGLILNTSHPIVNTSDEFKTATDQQNIDMKGKEAVSKSELVEDNKGVAEGITPESLQCMIDKMKEKKRQNKIIAAENIANNKSGTGISMKTDKKCSETNEKSNACSTFFNALNKAIGDKHFEIEELHNSDFDEDAFKDDTEKKTCSESNKVISESTKLQKESDMAVLTDLTEEACETQCKKTGDHYDKAEAASKTDNEAKDPTLTALTPTLPFEKFNGESVQIKENTQPNNDKFEDAIYEKFTQKDNVKFKHLKYLLNTFENNDWLKGHLHQFQELNNLITLSDGDSPNCLRLLYNLATAIREGKIGTIITTKSNANFWLKEYINESKINQENDLEVQKEIDDLFQRQTALLKASLMQNKNITN